MCSHLPMDPLEEFDHLIMYGQSDFPAIGLKLNPPQSDSPIIRGPRSGTDAGNQFRKFWGDKSEIRHVDGDLFECVLWNSSKNVTLQIVNHVLSKKFVFAGGTSRRPWYQVTSTRLNALLSPLLPPQTFIQFPPRASTLHLIRSVDQLNSLLFDLNKHLPLNIMGVQPISAEFRGTSVFAPILTIDGPPKRRANSLKHKSWRDVHEILRPLYVILNLETSGKWPRDNYQAFLHMKRLFLLRIHELLIHKGVPSRVIASGMLDIFVNGIVIRTSFCQPLEQTLLSRSLAVNHQKFTKATSESNQPFFPVASDDLHEWLLFNDRLPAVTSQLVGISRSYLNSFPEACRLAKRWLSAHGFPVIQCPDPCTEPGGLTSHSFDQGDADLGVAECRLSEIAVELIIVHVGSFTPPVRTSSYTAGLFGTNSENFASSSPLATFLRFLRFLYSFDWARQPLLIDLNEGFSEGEGREKADIAVTTFKVTPREDLPAMVLVTPLDLSGTDWTSRGPTVSGLKRLQTLAKHSYDLLRAMLVAGARLSDLKAVFRPDLSKMDVLITLKPAVYKTRLLEAVDIDLPSWTHKRSSDRSNGAQPSASIKEPSPVTLELPNPGARFWPKGYLCDPVTWSLRQIHRLSAFACHRELPSGELGLTVNVKAALEGLRLWLANFIDSVRIRDHSLFELPGKEIQTFISNVVSLGGNSEEPVSADESDASSDEPIAKVPEKRKAKPTGKVWKRTKKAKISA
ncbi:unnamed protein product [Mesocestoides corti]|uniref:Nucleolar protein 6 n=1 Tax=Mesocestoides corti TaxID=53468 RepID=A0A158QU65_MESCO|nr:unnamed protein product [Mesocestoides corti]